MSRLAVLLLIVGLSSLAFAETSAPVEGRVTVEQLELLLTKLHSASDGKVTSKLFNLELTERASSPRLQRWLADFPGKHTREALLALADASAFLDLPAAEIPPMAVPEADELKRTFWLAVASVVKNARELPNFSAKRNTMHFIASMPLLDLQADIPWHFYLVHKTAVTVTYRDGQEVKGDGASEGDEPGSQGIGLTTSGEFGPILATVIGDAVHGQVSWGHWEQGTSGPVAVVQYVVPQRASHYTVSFGLIAIGNDRQQSKPQIPAYHGEIAIDPESGSILRLTLDTELNPPYQEFRHSVAVEYSSVTIGDRAYICPTKAVALSRMPIASTGWLADPTNTVFTTYLNHVEFTDYHVFRAGVRILP